MNIYKIYSQQIPDFIKQACQCKAMQRLKDVGMNCGCEYTSFPLFKNIQGYSRYEHSLGVGLIAWHFTQDKKQALAGLFHDIATPCFAHVIDFLNGDHQNQSSTEEFTTQLIMQDEDIMNLLEQLGITVDEVCDYHLYPICDNDTPQLSADRLEYTLGNIVNYGFNSEQAIIEYYNNLTVSTNEQAVYELMFTDEKIAERFELDMLKCSKVYECDNDRMAMESLAILLKEAIQENVISKEDLYQHESVVIEKLKANITFNKKWEHFCNLSQTLISETQQDGYMKVLAKKRYIDSYVKDKGRISSLSSNVKDEINQYKEKGFDYYLKAI